VKKQKDPLKSREACFLASLIKSENMDQVKHPLLSVLAGQLEKLLIIVDSKESYQQWVHKKLDQIQEEWNGAGERGTSDQTAEPNRED